MSIRKKIKDFSVEYFQVLDESGNASEKVDLPEDTLKVMYHLMTLSRVFDDKLFHLQRSGKIGTYAQLKGQEGCQVGSALAMDKGDWLVPSFREMGCYLTRGADRVKIVQTWKGDNRGFQGDKDSRNLPVSIPIASQALHAAGIAWASKLRNEKVAAVTYFGDGATSEGDFHEAMNFAGTFKLPVVFICQNNQWAISTPRTKQTASATIAQKAIAYGFPGIQVDGNDVIAVYEATKQALERAKNGGGPTLIECLTYRMADHTTSDDSSKYRGAEATKEWEKKDPILRLKLFLQKKGWWSDGYADWVQSEVDKEVNGAVEKGLALPPPPPEELFKHIYAELPQNLIEQQKELLDELRDEV